MALYKDLYVRNLINDSGNLPRTGSMSMSPDIIPWGMTPQPEPQTYFANNYGTDVGQALTASARNYLYVRGKNLSDKAASGKVYLYWAKSSLLLYPSQWKNNAMKTSSGKDFVEVSAENPNDIVVSADPFTWTPEMPGGNFHYCLVGRVATSQNPNAIPETGNIQDFAGWVANNGGIGWRNVSVVDANSPTLTQSVLYDQGNTEAKVRFTVTCTGCPIGSEVSFSSGTPLPSGKPVAIPRTPISRSDSFIVGTAAAVPAKWMTDFSISYWSNGKPPLPGWGITLIGSIIVEPNDKLFNVAHTHEALGFSGGIHVDDQGKWSDLGLQAGPSREIVIGSFTLRHGARP